MFLNKAPEYSADGAASVLNEADGFIATGLKIR